MTRTSWPVRRGISGFNLLPWRRDEMRRLRRRRALEWFIAALLGCACAAPLAGWHLWQRMRIDGERQAIERSLAPLRPMLAARRALVREARERDARAAAAREQAKPLARVFALLDGLGAANIDGVSLHQVVHRAHETGLQASARDEAATAAWLAWLRALPDVEAVSVSELKRGPAGGGTRGDARPEEPLQLTARVVWAGASADAARAAVPAAKAGAAGRRSVQ
ncbi:hypothetical protein [Paraburkholderia caballeronis]|uniref:Type IV pilus assembly protein PilN n=1 Tax=Paraburkholderia caballeronis TaxID=416943 RepID=A0A1H7UXY4_9BURK|nr:hypothetical protein [Paraburkholderia caballeronis]PXW17404.1 type IV pilus assembly protein PilN [Paraburkholderia caballeronis]PXW94856.1 type IV pilus assembly protein PilN [Paraburkholderia caballeronis]RAJ90754.1 type IV pilus assembly protein PilN [Paraburkholderia caballeronis]SEB56160.1 type IV pilus assembly protein PilN [Paraburkholderia caballeronis]SEM01515.1 type IV pilus assembly protein PilN [Paraburkholderia caballeronis]